ncbi:GntR family transcriptional regulator [Salipiger pallidus]|uniref:GntR family transcriptional regulator n=1 Tax=Salipiger pallidus TaxID=1775170 RepID=UPI00166F45A5
MPTAPKGDAAFKTLRREIISCCARPGSTLSEPEVLAKFDLGKTTCRVALQQLAASGLVQALPPAGLSSRVGDPEGRRRAVRLASSARAACCPPCR